MNRIILFIILLSCCSSILFAQAAQPGEEELWSKITSLYSSISSVGFFPNDANGHEVHKQDIPLIYNECAEYEQSYPDGKYKIENKNLLAYALGRQLMVEGYSDKLSRRFYAFMADTTLDKIARVSLLEIQAQWNKTYAEPLALEFLKKNPDYKEAYLPVFHIAQNYFIQDKEKALQLFTLCTSCPDKNISKPATGFIRQTQALNKPFPMSFTATDGRKVDIKKLKGNYVLIDFWATWCGPCVGEMPKLKGLYEKWQGKGLEIIGISADEDYGKLTTFLTKNNITWPQYFNKAGWNNQFMQEWGISGIPMVFLVDKKGNLISTDARGKYEQLESLLQGKNVSLVNKDINFFAENYFASCEEQQNQLKKYMSKIKLSPKQPLSYIPYTEDSSRLAFKVQYLPFYLEDRYQLGGIACTWENGQLISRNVSDKWTLPELLYNLGYSRNDFLGDKDLLEKEFQGDFHLLKGASLESIKPALEKTLSKVWKKPVKLSITTVPRKTIILTSKYQYSGFAKVTAGEIICLTDKEPNEKTTILPQKGKLSEVFNLISRGADIPVILNLEGNSDPEIQYWFDKLPDKDNYTLLLNNLLKQTGLSMKEEQKEVMVLVIK
jgi:thiol-disulfide isomerase/thioredoxin